MRPGRRGRPLRGRQVHAAERALRAPPATRGTVFYDGVDLYAHYEELRSRIGFVPQDDVLYRELQVSRLLEYAAELAFPPDVSRAEQLGRIDEVLRELGLEERRDLRVEQLSGGERKRVSVAIELLTKPSLLFLDEPTSGLDPGDQRTLMELLRALADGGRTVIVVTHSTQSLRLCDRVLILAPGGGEAYFGPPQFAPSYFGRDDFQQIFQDLTARPSSTGARVFARTPITSAIWGRRRSRRALPRPRRERRPRSSVTVPGCSSSER